MAASPPSTSAHFLKRLRPLRDAFLIAFLIYACFAGSGLWTFHQAKTLELSHHRRTVERAAVMAAQGVNRALLTEGDFVPGHVKSTAVHHLQGIEAQDSAVSRLTVVKPSGDGHVVLVDTKKPAPESQATPDKALSASEQEVDAASVTHVVKTKANHSITRVDGSVKAYAPVLDKNTVVGVVTAESARHTLDEALATITRATVSANVVGLVLAFLAGGLFYFSRKKAYRAAELLERAEKADRLVVQTVGQIFYEHDLSHDRIQWRGDTQKILGASTTRVAPAGVDWEERIHPADRELFRKVRQKLAEDRQPFSFEYRVRRSDGHFIWLLDRGGVLSDEPGAPQTVIGVLLDVTASREAEQRLRDVVDAAGEYIWEVDTEGRYTYVSDRVREVLGYEPKALLGTVPFDYVPEEELSEVKARSAKLTFSKSPFRDFEHRMQRQDGRIIWLSLNGVPTFDADGRWTGFRGAGLDITSRKSAEEAIIREKEASDAAVRAKSQFLAMMSHEIRTPLNSVLGFSDLLSASNLDATQRDHVRMISRSGDALLALLNDILDFSRIESEALALHLEHIDVRACLEEVIDLYRPVASAKSVSLILDVADDVPDFLHTDRARLRQILLNLVGNAVKFTLNGAVQVSARIETKDGAGRELRISVRDTGVGIPPEKQGLLFQPFSQVDSSTTRRFGGTGLGLAICKRLAELLGAKVGLDHSDENGSVFYFSAEIEPGPEKEGELQQAVFDRSARWQAQSSVRILVTEDNYVSRLVVQKMLASLGLECEMAENGRECVNRHKASPFDLIFMDVQMPVLDGLSATSLIRKSETEGGRKVHIVALTADAMSGDRERCLAAGMDDYLSKPIRTEALAQLLESRGFLVRG